MVGCFCLFSFFCRSLLYLLVCDRGGGFLCFFARVPLSAGLGVHGYYSHFYFVLVLSFLYLFAILLFIFRLFSFLFFFLFFSSLFFSFLFLFFFFVFHSPSHPSLTGVGCWRVPWRLGRRGRRLDVCLSPLLIPGCFGYYYYFSYCFIVLLFYSFFLLFLKHFCYFAVYPTSVLLFSSFFFPTSFSKPLAPLSYWRGLMEGPVAPRQARKVARCLFIASSDPGLFELWFGFLLGLWDSFLFLMVSLVSW